MNVIESFRLAPTRPTLQNPFPATPSLWWGRKIPRVVSRGWMRSGTPRAFVTSCFRPNRSLKAPRRRFRLERYLHAPQGRLSGDSSCNRSRRVSE